MNTDTIETELIIGLPRWMHMCPMCWQKFIESVRLGYKHDSPTGEFSIELLNQILVPYNAMIELIADGAAQLVFKSTVDLLAFKLKFGL